MAADIHEPGVSSEDSSSKSKDSGGLTPEHQKYLLQRHGTLELDPVPSADPDDPYNWPTWKKVTNLILIALQCTSALFIAAGIIPAQEALAEEYGISLQQTSYLTSEQIAILGFGPWFWTPISNRYGRRPVFLVALLGSCIANIGSAVSHDYASQAACRAIGAFFISPAFGIGGLVVTETFFANQRGRYLGIWTALITLGPPMGPFFMGFVVQRVSYTWIFWIFAIMNAVHLILYIFLGPETLYIRDAKSTSHPSRASSFRARFFRFRRINPQPLRAKDFIRPAVFGFQHITVFIPALAYGLVFAFCSVFLTVLVPQLFVPTFGFGPQQIGLQFLGLIIGTIIGEQASGPLSDHWMKLRIRHNQRLGKERPQPEWRLFMSYLGFATAIAGLVIFTVQISNLEGKPYNVSPIIGAGIAAFGNQIVTTVLVTYAIDCHPKSEAATIGSFINAIRQTLGFVGPFWYTPMYQTIGLKGSAGLMSGLILVVSIVPVIFLQLRALRWSSKVSKT